VIVLPDGNKEVVTEFFDRTTNNVAEYTGLIIGLEKAQELGIKDAIVKGDSNLVVKQVKGEWKVKQPHLKPLCERAKLLAKQFNSIDIQWGGMAGMGA